MHRSLHTRGLRAALLVLGLVGVMFPGVSLASEASGLAVLPTTLPQMAPQDRSRMARLHEVAPLGTVEPGAGRQRLIRARSYTLDLYRKGDHVPQYDRSWCVGASMQMMINMIEPGRPDRTRRTQARLYRFARRVDPWVETRPGASVYGWSEGLEKLGHGRYDELMAPTLQGILRRAAKRMRSTQRPVGLLVWDGEHAWVMSGFRATADPALTDDFKVTHVWVEDPWTGRVSRAWGAGLEAHTLLTTRQLRADFVRYSTDHPRRHDRAGKYVIVAPMAEAAAPVS